MTQAKVQVAIVQHHPLASYITVKFTDGAILSIPHRDLILRENRSLEQWLEDHMTRESQYFVSSQIPPVDIPGCLSAYLFTHPASPKASYKPAPVTLLPPRPRRLIKI